jgi:hypothetical protein
MPDCEGPLMGLAKWSYLDISAGMLLPDVSDLRRQKSAVRADSAALYESAEEARCCASWL